MTDLDATEARALTDQIKTQVSELLPLIVEAFQRRADRALGYDSWAGYSDAELRGLRLPIGDRREAVAELRGAGMSTRAIGSALGVDQSTVVRDLATDASASVEAPERVTGLDGRERPAAMPRPPIVDPIPPAVAEQIERRIAEKVQPQPETTKSERPRSGLSPSGQDARLDAELDAEMEGTVQRFRRNFATARVRAGEITTYDVDRINEVYAGNWDREVGDLLNALDAWTAKVRESYRGQQRTGLRLVGGGQA